MNQMAKRLLMALGAVLLLSGGVGCSQTQHYDLAVRNQTPQPLTIWLTKNGPEDEPAWRSPEEIAIGQVMTRGGPVAGVVIQPERVATTKIDGKFAGDTRAILRIYRGQLGINEILAISNGSPDRLDIYLPPGVSRILVQDTDAGRLKITPVKEFAPTQ